MLFISDLSSLPQEKIMGYICIRKTKLTTILNLLLNLSFWPDEHCCGFKWSGAWLSREKRKVWTKHGVKTWFQHSVEAS